MVSGEPIAYSVAGDRGTPVVLVHGGAGSRRDWEQNIPALAAFHRVYVPDLIGYGENARSDATYTIQHFSDFLREFIYVLNVGTAYLVGHSLGGRICLEVAGHEPDRIAKLVVIAPIGFGKLSIPGMALATAAWMLFKITPRRLPYPKLDIELDDLGLDGFRNMKTPTLILWGKRDLYFPPRYGMRTQQMIPNSRLKLLAVSGHSPHRKETSRFNETVLDFFQAN